ncbi:MAG: hypothetical protein G01um1014106_632, partial [Parcubacteria group bacterium Gr01-1014_106]
MTHEQDAVCFYPTGRGPTHPLSASIIDGFCTHVIDERKLKILDALKQIEHVPFFLIAATGLGKTLVVPLWLLYQMMHAKPANALKEAGPRIWVIEPKIAIAQGLAAEMNRSWSDYSRKNGEQPFPLFGCKTKVDNLNLDAPIMFVTTGIFSIYARKGVFRPGTDFVLVDEAHVTLETDEAFELGIGICRQREVNLSYMSASVDPADIPDRLGAHVYRAEAKRFPVWRHNLGCALDDCLVRLVERTLIEPDPEDDIFPAGDPEWGGVRKSVFETGRAKGMLVIVNSFSSKESDAKRLERDLRKAPFADKIRIGLLAGEVLRDPERRRRYEADLLTWKREKARYVLI